jgi:hypothetical protein
VLGGNVPFMLERSSVVGHVGLEMTGERTVRYRLLDYDGVLYCDKSATVFRRSILQLF